MLTTFHRNVVQSAGAFGGVLREAITAEDHRLLVLRLTAALILLHGSVSSSVQIPITIFAGAILVFPAVIYQAWLWWPLVLLVGADYARHWYTIDNHKYLIWYWLTSCAIAIRWQWSTVRIASTARQLIAVVFLFATIWKVIGGQYVDGSFLHAAFMTDGRLQPIAGLIVGSDASKFVTASAALRYVGGLGLADVEVSFPAEGRLMAFTFVLSWLTILVEGSVCAAHLSGTRTFYRLRHYVLMSFIAGTYFMFPVLGFAFVLGVLGLAQCDSEDRPMRLKYVGILALIQFTQMPWREFFR